LTRRPGKFVTSTRFAHAAIISFGLIVECLRISASGFLSSVNDRSPRFWRLQHSVRSTKRRRLSAVKHRQLPCASHCAPPPTQSICVDYNIRRYKWAYTSSTTEAGGYASPRIYRYRYLLTFVRLQNQITCYNEQQSLKATNNTHNNSGGANIHKFSPVQD